MNATQLPESHAPQTIEPVIGEADIDAAIETCGGDVRNTILSLLLALDSARRDASWGYVRGRPSRSVSGQEG
ncbi:hypothetical protein [Ancylobacter sp.]|uniref:hypothetical protein n=1 Tax=Ancylobacter sp. TaxID=1872567 RepID=UPI003D13491D